MSDFEYALQLRAVSIRYLIATYIGLGVTLLVMFFALGWWVWPMFGLTLLAFVQSRRYFEGYVLTATSTDEGDAE